MPKSRSVKQRQALRKAQVVSGAKRKAIAAHRKAVKAVPPQQIPKDAGNGQVSQ